MYDDDFRNTFFEFLHEYSDTPEMLNTLKPFIEYGWSTIQINGVKDKECDQRQVEFVNWMSDNGATLTAIQAAIKLMTE